MAKLLEVADSVSGELEHNEPVAEKADSENVTDEQDTGDKENVSENLDEDTTLGALAKGLFGYSKIHAAAITGQADSLNLLLKDPANVSDVNSKTVEGGYTPLHLAASAGHDDCIAELLNCDEADIHVTDAFDRTPLETAEQNFKSATAKLLRSYGKYMLLDGVLAQAVWYQTFLRLLVLELTISNLILYTS